VATDPQFVENVINHTSFGAATVTTRFIESTPERFNFGLQTIVPPSSSIASVKSPSMGIRISRAARSLI